MAKYEIYVVTTEIEGMEGINARNQLNQLKVELSNKFGGYTIFHNCEGGWTDNGQLCVDKVEVWRILTDEIVTAKEIMKFAETIKTITKQKSQLVTVNDKQYFI
jgi:hypothetical protein